MPTRLCVTRQRQSAAKRTLFRSGCVCLAFLALGWFGLVPRTQAAESNLADQQASTTPTKTQRELVANYGKLPLSFEANQGQVSGPAKFLSRGRGYTLLLTGDEAILSLAKAAGGADAGGKPGVTTSVGKPTTDNESKDTESVLRMKLMGASANAAVTGAEELPGKSNYFIGNDPAQWRANVPNYAQVRYGNVYPGVDLVYYGSQGGQLEYDFVVAPGADPHAIGLSFQGAGQLRVDKETGDLVLTLDGSELRFRKPVVYQEESTVDSRQPTVQDEKRNTADTPKSRIQNRRFLDGRFVFTGKSQVGFEVAAYDHRAPLTIDPILIYSTYLGGGQYNIGYRVAVDASGNAYVAGATNSTDFPTTAGVFSSIQTGTCYKQQHGVLQATFACPDAFVTKLDPTGTQLIYSTYLGGTAPAGATGISVDSSGNAYVTGSTSARDFPTTTGAYQTSAPLSGSWRGHTFTTKLNATGAALVYSTYLAGTHDDYSTTSALDSSGDLYVAGFTTSKDFPTTAGAFQTTISGNSCENYGQQWPCPDGFIAELNPQATALIYSTFLGGSGYDAVLGLALDSTGSAYVTGGTSSTDFPTANALYSSFGATTCGTTQGGYPKPCFHAFVAELNPTGTALTYSSFLAGNGDDSGFGIAVDSTGAAYVTGATTSNPFLATASSTIQSSFSKGTCITSLSSAFCPNAFVAKLAPLGASLAYSTYLGGSGFDFGWSIAVDSAGNAYVVGGTGSVDFPTDATTGNFQGGSCSTGNVFSTKYSFNCPNAFLSEIDPTGSSLLFSTYLGGASGDIAFGVALDSAGSAYVSGSTLSSNFPISAGAFQTSMTGKADAFVSKFGLSPAATPTFSVPAGNYSSPQTVTISDTTTGATIYYTTNDTTPTTSSTQYTGTITVNSTETIEAIATAGGYATSAVATATYTFGSLPIAGVSPATLTFAALAVNSTSTGQAVTLANAGSAALAVASIALTGNFAQTNNCGTSVAAGGSCTINVTFSPLGAGSLEGTLTITDNSNGTEGSTQTVSLSGTGQDYTITTPSGSSASATVAPGSPATYSLSVGGEGGLSGSVSFSCTGAPSEATCTVSPNPATAGSSPTTVTVTVTTTAPSAGTPRSRPVPPTPLLPGLRGLLMLALALATMALAITRRNQPGVSRWQSPILPLAAGLLLTLALAGCGGGGSGGGTTSNPGTPAGTYSLTVTGTTGSGSSALSHNVTLTLTVS